MSFVKGYMIIKNGGEMKLFPLILQVMIFRENFLFSFKESIFTEKITKPNFVFKRRSLRIVVRN
jgi:hypothetical protein